MASMHLSGHQNGLWRRCILASPPSFSLGVIVAKDRVMVHLNLNLRIGVAVCLSL